MTKRVVEVNADMPQEVEANVQCANELEAVLKKYNCTLQIRVVEVPEEVEE